MPPRVSIIIPCFNAERWLTEAMESCLEQSYSDVEVIAVDDGSTDRTLTVLRQLAAANSSRLTVLAQSHAGLCAARNAGAGRAQGGYFLFLDADDYLTCDGIARAVEASEDGRMDAVFGDWINFDEKGVETRISGAWFHPGDPLASLLRRPPVSSSVLVRRNASLWRESIVPWDVFDYFLMLVLSGFRAKYVPYPLSKVRQHDSPGRLSILKNHFDPLTKGRLYADFKTMLHSKGELNEAREEALDMEILANAYSLYRAKRKTEAVDLLQHVHVARLPAYSGYKRFGLTGFLHAMGAERGMKWFYGMNRLVGRA